MTASKTMKTTAGCLICGTGYALKLAEWGLSAAEVVLNGAENMADSFAKAPKLGIGKSLFGGLKKGTNKVSAFLIKKGKELTK